MLLDLWLLLRASALLWTIAFGLSSRPGPLNFSHPGLQVDTLSSRGPTSIAARSIPRALDLGNAALRARTSNAAWS